MSRRRQHYGPARALQKTQRWRALRLQALRRDGFQCVQCGRRGRLEVDHIQPVHDRPDLTWELSNLQSLCGKCHGAKTKREMGIQDRGPERQRWADLLRDT